MEALRRTVGVSPFQQRGDYAYAFDGLNIAVTEAVQHERGTSTHFTTHWVIVNRDSDTKFVAISTDSSETYIQLARTAKILSVSPTGIAACSRRYHRQTGCTSYTTLWPGQRLTFTLRTSLHAGERTVSTIDLRARFTAYEERSRWNPSSQPVNMDVEFRDINLSRAAWRDEDS